MRTVALTEADEALEQAERGGEGGVSDREAALKHAEDVSEAWEGLRVAPEPIVQAVNSRMALFDTVGEVLDGLDLKGNENYRDKVKLSERDANGDPPPIRALVFNRATALAKKRTRLLQIVTLFEVQVCPDRLPLCSVSPVAEDRKEEKRNPRSKSPHIYPKMGVAPSCSISSGKIIVLFHLLAWL